ncbi:MAG: nitrilase [Gemmatimonadetes bacterium]|jgi:predicted amidohydrolase|nr:nitrilase [Gemmatimonadota bacterium]MBT6144028.1 nitrilase [Gemmatimonadota bacterium]MBT7859530.1 nitrilase [Gemmatimonadota bacterium]
MLDVRIAVAQMTSVVGDTATNLGRIRRLVGQACDEDVDILCLPELCINGYNAGDNDHPAAEDLDGPSVRVLCDLGKQTGLTFLAGLLERDVSGIVFNTQIVFGPDGVQGHYRKTHVPTTENGTWCQGGDLPVFDHPKVRFGIEICYDSHFPEVSTELAERGAEVLFLPHASGGESHEAKLARWLRYMPARAYDNTVYVAVCNQVGDNGAGRVFTGVSFVCDARGQVIAQAAHGDQEEMVVADLASADLQEARRVPETFFRHFRRPTLYNRWQSER